MAAGNVVLWNHYADKLHEISYKPLQTTQKGVKMVYFTPNAQTSTNMRFQLGPIDGIRCRCPFGANAFNDPTNSALIKNLELSIEDPELVKFFQDFDEANIKAALANPSWFKGGPKSEDNIRTWYRKSLAFDEDEKGNKYAPRLHTKINTAPGDRCVRVLLHSEVNGEDVYTVGTADDIKKNTRCIPICEASGIWFQTSNFGMSIRTTDLLVFPDEERKECNFIGGNRGPLKRLHDVIDDCLPPPSMPLPPAGSDSVLFASTAGQPDIKLLPAMPTPSAPPPDATKPAKKKKRDPAD